MNPVLSYFFHSPFIFEFFVTFYSLLEFSATKIIRLFRSSIRQAEESSREAEQQCEG